VYCSIRHSGLTVTKLAAEELGLRFSTLPIDLPRARLILGLHEHDMHEVWLSLKREATIGRLFGADNATDKGTNEQLGRLARLLDPAIFSECIPETWVLPEYASALQAAMSAQPREVFILKPRNSSEGNGIRLLMSFEDVGDSTADAVVQRYVSTPLLLGGLKFDLRMYVLVKRLQPLEIWMCHEGLARFCTEEYEAPSRKNRHKVTSHLTNYSLNKRAPNFVHTDDPDGANGSKRSLSSVLPLILEALPGIDEEELWARLSQATILGMMPLVPFLVDAERQQRQAQGSNVSHGPHFSQLFGVDLLLDKDGAAWLLEVNSFPSLSLDSTVPFLGEGKCCRCMHDYKPHTHVQSAVDHHVKLAVVSGTIQLLLGRHPDICTGHGDAASGGESESAQEGARDTSFTLLVQDEAAGFALEALTNLAEAFGKCCKGGAAIADPFRLRKLCVAMIGEDAREVDQQLRQVAQQSEGLSFLSVAGFLLDRLRARRPNEPLLDVLLAALQEAPGGM